MKRNWRVYWAVVAALVLAVQAAWAGRAYRGWHRVGVCGAGTGTAVAEGTFHAVTTVRVACISGGGRVSMVWVEDGGHRYQIGVNRTIREGETFTQDIGCMGVTGVRIFDTGNGVYRVDVYENDRMLKK
jgi:hypothetical protein